MKAKTRDAEIVEKLDEILKTLRRIEAKPVNAPMFVPMPYYQPYYPYYVYPQPTWTIQPSSVTVGSVGVTSGSWMSTGSLNGTTVTSAKVPFTLTAGGN